MVRANLTICGFARSEMMIDVCFLRGSGVASVVAGSVAGSAIGGSLAAAQRNDLRLLFACSRFKKPPNLKLQDGRTRKL
jgi:hypothetical protein